MAAYKLHTEGMEFLFYNMERNVKMLAVILLALITWGCSRSEAPVDPVEQQLAAAYLFIEEDLPLEAIAILEKLLATDPNNKEIRLALASSYLHIAGLSFDKFMALAKALEENEMEKQTFDRYSAPAEYLRSSGSPEGRVIADMLVAYNRGVYVIDRLIRSIETIPVIDSTQAKALNQAILVLSTIDPLDRGMSLFRSVLRVVSIKYDWDQRKYFGGTENCQISFSDLDRGFQLLVRELGFILTDLQRGLPDRSDDFVHLQRQLDQAALGLAAQENQQLRSQIPIEALLVMQSILPDVARCL